MPRVVVAAVVAEGGKVLLTKRRDDQHLAGLWEFPGGKLEDGESPEQALIRECREECGIEIEVGEVLEVTFHRYSDRDVLILFYACTRERGEVQNLEVADHAWVAPEDLDRYALPPADAAVVARVQSKMKATPPR